MRRPRAADRPPAAFLELTCALDRRSHRIDPGAHRAGLVEASGRFRAVCGRSVLVTSLLTAPGPRCPVCARATPD